MPPHGVRCSAERIAGRVDALAGFTEPDRPWTRLVFSDEYRAARNWLEKTFTEAGLVTRIDDGGNLVGRREAAGKTGGGKKIIIGSHIDTVPAGGRYDGVAGVLAALEVAEILKDTELPFAVEVVDFLGEELNPWGLSCLGSRHMAGILTPDMLARRDEGGRVLGAEIKSVGGTGTVSARDEGDEGESPLACFELHIEQATRLESAGVDLGIVTVIPAIHRYGISVGGVAAHSGGTAMKDRKDALVTASRIIDRVSVMAGEIADKTNGHFVATVGKVDVHPNAATVIAGAVEMTLDIRSPDAAMIEDFTAAIREVAAGIADAADTKTGFELLAATDAAPMDGALRKVLATEAEALGLSALELASGGGHDSAHLSRFAPAAMVFIPCRDGLSHCPEEFAEAVHIARGGDVIAAAVLDLAARV